ncbi:MAG: hypothetical protein IPN90_13555 [Elusimicrobia bacterium]|nr:hypothetical protein [Elusimicrobiota bacterium]
MRRILLTPLPHTPSIEKVLPSLNSVKRGFATAMAAIIFYSQAVCAGTTSLPLLSTHAAPGQTAGGGLSKQTNLLHRLMKLTGVSKTGAPSVFHENEYRDRMKLTVPGQDPETLKRQQEGQEARRDIENTNIKAARDAIPELDRPDT